MPKSTPPKPLSPSKLAKPGKQGGIELSETQLGKVSGGDSSQKLKWKGT